MQAAQVADVQAECFAEDVDLPDPLPCWTEEQWVAYFESGGDAAAAIEVLAPKQSSGPVRYEVVHTACFVRASPNTSAKAVGQHPRGTVVEAGEVRGGWVLLSDTTPPLPAMSPTGECWMLIDGKEVGLGELLRPLAPQMVCPHLQLVAGRRSLTLAPHLFPPPRQTPAAIAAVLAARTDLVRFVAPVCYEVVAPSLPAYQLPDDSSRRLGEPLEAGARLLAQARCDGWVQLAPDHESQLNYGAAVSSAGWIQDGGRAEPTLRAAEKRLPGSTVWQVTRPGGCAAYSAPGGVVGGTLVESLVEGERVEVDAECGHWVRLKGVAQPAWVELDIFLAG